MNFFNRISASVNETSAFYKQRRQFDDLVDSIRKKTTLLNDTKQLDAQLDLIVHDLREQLRRQNLQKVDLGPQRAEFQRKWIGLITIDGLFESPNARFVDPTSLYRYGGCVLSAPRDDQRVFTFSLALRTACLQFDAYTLRCGPINTGGTLSVEARRNTVTISVVFHFKAINSSSRAASKKYKIQRIEVSRAELVKFSSLKVKITGFGNMGGNKLAKFAARPIVNRCVEKFKHEFENEIKKQVKSIIDTFTV